MSAVSRIAWIFTWGCAVAFHSGPVCASGNDAAREISIRTQEVTRPDLAVSPDQNTLYFSMLGEIYKLPVSGGVATQLQLGSGWKTRPMVSPTGSRIAFLSDKNGRVGVWVAGIVALTRPRLLASPEDVDVISAAWVSDSEIATVAMSLTSVKIYSLAISKELGAGSFSSVSTGIKPPGMKSLSAGRDERYLFMLSQGIQRLDRTTGETIKLAEDPGLSQPLVTFDGLHLGYVKSENSQKPLLLKDLSNGVVHETGCKLSTDEQNGFRNEASYVFTKENTAVVFEKDGYLYECTFGGETLRIPFSAEARIFIEPQVKPGPERLNSHQRVRYLAYDEKQEKAVFVAGNHLWLSRTMGGAAERLTNDKVLEFMPSFSRSGASLAYVAVVDQAFSELRVLDLKTGNKRTLLKSEALLFNPVWSQDGERIAYGEKPFGSSGTLDLRWVEISGQGGTLGTADQTYGTNRRLPVLTWDTAGKGVFLTQQEGFKRRLIYQPIAGPAQTLYDLDITIWDARVSNSGKLVAFQSGSGVYVSPFAGIQGRPTAVTGLDLLKMRQVNSGAVDHFAWTNAERLSWIQSNDLFISDLSDNVRKLDADVPAENYRPRNNRRAYQGARIITMGDMGTIDNGTIVTVDGRVEYIGKSADLRGIPKSQITNLTGKTIIPGLIDTHYHSEVLEFEATFPVVKRMFSSLAYGVTTVYDPSLPTLESSILTEISKSPEYFGPTFYGSGFPIIGASSTANQATIESYDDAHRMVSDRANSGARLVKDYLQTTRAQRSWIAQAARELGVGVTAHERDEFDMRAKLSLVKDGYTAIEHGLVTGSIHDDVIQYIAKSGIVYTPTIVVEGQSASFVASDSRSHSNDIRRSCLMNSSDNSAEPEANGKSETSKYEESFGFAVARDAATILNSGGRVSTGAHGVAPGLDTHWETWLLAFAGATPLNALRAATIHGARKLGLEDRIGSLTSGKDADFIVLNSDPLENIRNTVDIDLVVKKGRQVSWPENEFEPGGWKAESNWTECQSAGFGARRQ